MVKISFLGDISFNNCYNYFHDNNVNPFDGIDELLQKSDFNIGNLECLAKGNEGENKLKHPRLNTRVETLNLLKYLNRSDFIRVNFKNKNIEKLFIY